MKLQPVDRSAMKLTVGRRLRLTFSEPGSVHTSNCMLLGWRNDEFMIVDLPHEFEIRRYITHEKAVSVLYIGERSLWSFDTWILRVFQVSVSCMHLAFPASVNRGEWRRAARVPVCLDAVLRASNGAVVRARVLDLSVGGASIEVVDPYDFGGDNFVMEVGVGGQLGTDQSSFSATVKVVRTSTTNSPQIGVIFVSMETECRFVLHQVLLDAMSDR